MPARTKGTMERQETCCGAADFSRATDACAEVQPNEDGCCAVRVWSPSTGASVQVVLSQEQMWQMMRSYFQVQSRPRADRTGPTRTRPDGRPRRRSRTRPTGTEQATPQVRTERPTATGTATDGSRAPARRTRTRSTAGRTAGSR